MYVFDSSALIDLFSNYYRNRFPSLWEKFDILVEEGKIISVKEVKKELESFDDSVSEWAKNNSKVFLSLTNDEAEFIKLILNTKGFKDNIKKQQLLSYRPLADCFVIAKAKMLNIYVVSSERYKPHGAKIPNICEYFGVSHLNLQEFMEKEKWTF